ncbi:MAG: TPM domain-containing protein [Chitinophagaceae bacterium]
MFQLFRKKKPFFSEEENRLVVEAIRYSEKRTSGEIRVFVESRCKYVNALDRAAELFSRLEMQKTDDRNAVLVYLAMKDHQLAVFGDENIHKKVGTEYWTNVVTKMLKEFDKEDFANGIRQCVTEIGEALHFHFPYNNDTDKNELPDDIVFGK